jgi:hypothetical protein
MEESPTGLMNSSWARQEMCRASDHLTEPSNQLKDMHIQPPCSFSTSRNIIFSAGTTTLKFA